MANFLKEHPVIVGALIATMPILISNLVQIYLHISENTRKDKEARSQAREKWIECDVLRIMNSIEKTMSLYQQYVDLRTRIQGNNGQTNRT